MINPHGMFAVRDIRRAGRDHFLLCFDLDVAIDVAHLHAAALLPHAVGDADAWLLSQLGADRMGGIDRQQHPRGVLIHLGTTPTK